MKSQIAFLSLAFAALSAALPAADPYIGYIYPAAIQAGSTNQFVIGGQSLWGRVDAWVSGGGVRVLEVESVPGFPFADQAQRNYLKKWLDGIDSGHPEAPPMPELKPTDAWRTNAWWMALDKLGPKERAIVARDLWIRKNPLQAAPSLKQLTIVTLAADADARPGPRQMRLLRKGDGSISAPRPLVVTAEPVVEEPLYTPHADKAVPPPAISSLPAVAAGQIMPGETDRVRFALPAGMSVRVSVSGRMLQPYVGDAVPGFFNPVVRVLDPDGREIAFGDDDSFRPDPSFVFKTGAAGEYAIEIFDRLFRGREDFVYSLAVADASSPATAASDPFAPMAPRRKFPACTVFAGDFADGARHAIEVREPGPLVFDLYSRRLGAATDGVLELEDAQGNALARWDDATNTVHVGALIQQELDPCGRYDFRNPGTYYVRVRESCGRRGAYELEVRPPTPHFRVYAKRSGFHLAKGQRVPFKVVVDRREGFAGPVTLVGNESCSLEQATIPADVSEATVTAVGLREAPSEPAFAALLAVGEAEGEAVCAKVLAADEYNQAFAWDHLLSMGDFVFASRRPSPPPKKKK